MILQSLNQHYQRLLERSEPGLSPFGYSPEKIGYAIVISPEGEPLNVLPLFDTSGKKPIPSTLSVPQPEKRTSGIKSNFLWDKTSYVLGVSATSKRTADEHAAFKALHLPLLANEDDPGLKALHGFLEHWTPARFASAPFIAAMLDANVVFRLDQENAYLHVRPAARALRERLLGISHAGADASASTNLTCLVTGSKSAIARLHPAIKGVNGAQSSGASLVSFNLDAFGSYGKSQGDNAPVSEQAAFAYTSMLNHLLRRDPHNRQRLNIGDTTVVFWAESGDSNQARSAEWLLAMMFSPDPPADDDQETEKIRRTLEIVAKGRPMSDVDPKLDGATRMHVLGLAPNAARLSIRFWLTDSLDQLTRRIAQHTRDLHLQPSPWRTAPSAWRLALATAPSRDGRAKSEDIPPHLAGELMRAILTGGRYPQSLIGNVIMRMRADGDVSGVRVALCKAVLQRDLRLARTHESTEEIPVSLDLNSKNPGYLLGRVFSVLENIQRAALGNQLNATIRDRYYGAASATPATIFPMLLRNTQNHLSRLRKDRPGAAINLERDIRDAIDKLPGEFPKSLTIQDQGRFAIGYYHQSQARFAKSEQAVDNIETDIQGATA